MANYKVVDAERLDADLASVADSIRAKAGTADQMAFPDGFKSAVEGIQAGGETKAFPEKIVYYNDMNGFEYTKENVLFSEYDAATKTMSIIDEPVTSTLWADASAAIMSDTNKYREITFHRTNDINSPVFIDNGYGSPEHPGFTIGAWFYRARSSGTYERLIHVLLNDGYLGLYIPPNSNAIQRDGASTSPTTISISNNQWFHLAYTLERVSGAMILLKTYLNGNLIATDEKGLSSDTNIINYMRIGASTEVNGYHWPGYVKNVFLSDGPLSDEEVRQMVVGENIPNNTPIVETNLNLQILSYPTIELLESDTPLAGTIGIVANVEIPSYTFSPSEPAQPTEGLIWIQTGMDSNVKFNAVQGNAVQVCPVLAKQYISGLWKNVAAKTYLKDEWVSWRVPLYDSGDEYKSWTGGWALKDLSHTGTTAKAPVITRYGDYVELKQNSTNTGGVYHCVKPVDLTGRKTLYFNGILKSANTNLPAWSCIRLWTSFGEILDDNMIHQFTSPVSGEVCFDVEQFDGEYYIGILVYQNGSSATLREMYVE